MPAFDGPISQWLSHAFDLADLFHDDAGVAAAIADRAVAGLADAADAQRKRLYYTGAAAQKQSKAYFPPAALLQFLVFAESEPFERVSERRGAATPAQLSVRYVKHLVAVSARRNSFHAALAICRLLFNYATAETMAIYDSILLAHDFVKEDYYYRARKRVLMRESEQRFPGLMRVQLARGEDRFVPASDQRAWLDLVLNTLEVLTPWGTRCLEDPTLIAKREQDEGAELARLHALIHPPCFEALVARAGLESPRRRLAMPRLRSENATVNVSRVGTMATVRSTPCAVSP